MVCDECGGTGMWDVLSSIPCSCMGNVNKSNTLNRIVRKKMVDIMMKLSLDV